VAWVLSTIAALTGIVAYLLVPGPWSWWLGSLGVIPLALLVAYQPHRRGRDEDERHDFTDLSGPWT